MSHIHVDVGQRFVSLAGGRKYASRSNSGSGSVSHYVEGNSRFDSGYARSSYEGSRSYSRSRRYTREASYERGYASGYNDSGTGHYTGGYATIYR